MTRKILVYKEPPVDFQSAAYATAVYIIVKNHLLILQLQPKKKEAYKWGVPAGKKEEKEEPLVAIRRELHEETGLLVENFTEVGILYIRKPELDYIYHLFTVSLKDFPEITLSDEHLDYKWVTIEEAKLLPLMEGALEALEFFKLHR